MNPTRRKPAGRGGARPGAGRPRKSYAERARSRSIRFTQAQEAVIVEWMEMHGLPDFSAALHDLVARGLGE